MFATFMNILRSPIFLKFMGALLTTLLASVSALSGGLVSTVQSSAAAREDIIFNRAQPPYGLQMTGDADEIADPEITATEFVEAVAPENYTEKSAVNNDQVRLEQELVVAVAPENMDAVEQLLDETNATAENDVQQVATVRQQITSETAVFGVTLPDVPAREAADIIFEYRYLASGQWSAWQELELAEPAESKENLVTVGTEPVPVTAISELEVIAKNQSGEVIPGAVLNIVAPEGEKMPAAAEITDDLAKLSAELGLNSVSENADSTSQPSENVLQSSVYTSSAAHTNSVGQQSSFVFNVLKQQDNKDFQSVAYRSAKTATTQSIASTQPFAASFGSLNSNRTTYTTSNGLVINTRKGWGANESWQTWGSEKTKFKGAVVHHTAGTNNYTKDQVPGIVRGIYHYHAVALQWGDVGYHLLIDKFGGVWEGRAGGLTSSNQGAHARGANAETFGVSVLGDYTSVAPSAAALNSLQKAIAWKMHVSGIKTVDGTIVVKGDKSGYSSLTVPIISGHRDIGYTACPGNSFYPLLTQVRKNVAAELKKLQAPQINAKWEKTINLAVPSKAGDVYYAGGFSAKGNSDALVVDSKGGLWLYPSTDEGKSFKNPKRIGTNWHSVDAINTGFDFNGDGNIDLIARNKKTGALLLYPGKAGGSFAKPQQIGTGWHTIDKITVFAKLNNQKPAIVGVRKWDGKLAIYTTNGSGKIYNPLVLGPGWKDMKQIIPLGDRNGDGIADLGAINSKGDFMFYAGKSDGKLATAKKIAYSWHNMQYVRGKADTGGMWAYSNKKQLLYYRLASVE